MASTFATVMAAISGAPAPRPMALAPGAGKGLAVKEQLRVAKATLRLYAAGRRDASAAREALAFLESGARRRKSARRPEPKRRGNAIAGHARAGQQASLIARRAEVDRVQNAIERIVLDELPPGTPRRSRGTFVRQALAKRGIARGRTAVRAALSRMDRSVTRRTG